MMYLIVFWDNFIEIGGIIYRVVMLEFRVFLGFFKRRYNLLMGIELDIRRIRIVFI